ncbi:hydroxyisourate hydrolase [Pedobacter changchengzhani]|uniref:5-hydroxyisourate hydrolase n=1 Tax=Pedobacter changchengzhani TaxID=2529274 RepID=A0A4R5MM53_9SPHI|nr:hydroxyisourate hydrolase [Pedobacter changchengzhani]TDG36199.1 hydroxyisourate hydrolase [Pedobacter changchengzhani]
MKKIILSLLVTLAAFTTYAQTPKYLLSSHILDISTGLPAPGVNVKLEKLDKTSNLWTMIDEKKTDKNGRIPDFLEENKSEKGIYKLTFLVADYFKSKKTESFYPFIEVVFEIKNEKHYHVPITLSPFGYSTYRGN